ncbi:MAG TPA: DNA repair protein RadA [Dehalococcoidales bacterium]|nr:DNA repair protein RadA [Dehalococcoidales bacterium]
MEKSEKAKAHSTYLCQQCGYQTAFELGRCPHCQTFGSLVKQIIVDEPKKRAHRTADAPAELSQVAIKSHERFPVPIEEFNRVLGGGIVPGSLTLIGGEPGIGKSTLLLQVAAKTAASHGNVIYVSGEETANQIKLRANRLGINGDGLFFLADTDIAAILERLESMEPELLIIDSIQTTHVPEDDGVPGSITQVRECAHRLMRWAKASEVPVFITGHVTKEGAIAGPRVLEHIVDVVLYLEGEQFSAYRLLRCVKNRFGSTNEIGVFEMKEKGLLEVENPSRAFLSGRQGELIGSIVVPVIEGSRPLLVEIQALTNMTAFGMPRRTANGVDYNRLLMIIAVLGKRLGMKLGNQDIMVNVTGGLKIDEPAADLGIALAIASSFRDKELDHQLAALGEIGLSGELRSVPQLERRVQEAARMGFKRVLVPKAGAKIIIPKEISLLALGTVREAVEQI